MNVLLSELPLWVQELISWITTGSSITALIGIIAALIKLGAAGKESRSVTSVQVNLLQTMVTKLSDTKELATSVQQVASQVSESLVYFEKALASQRQSNANLANFIMECFNKSNLSDEAKADLKVMADKIFYDDNTAVIEALKVAKMEADAALVASAEQIAKLTAELESERARLEKAQENVKANRRL